MNRTDDPSQPSHLARSRLLGEESGGLFRCQWNDAVFIHFAVAPGRLQPFVPFDLDLRDGRAYVSLVAFTLAQMRPRFGGPPLRWLTAPLSSQRFLNLRTYVRHNGEQGIYFLAEWLDSRLAVLLGPRLYGLPYRFAQLNYQHDPNDEVRGEVRADGALRYSAQIISCGETLHDSGTGILPVVSVLRHNQHGLEAHATINGRADANQHHWQPSLPNTLDEFLLERYTAFTHRAKTNRLFRVWHRPWPVTPAKITLEDTSLIASTGDWFSHAKLIGGHHSPGVKEVWMGWPRRLSAPVLGRTGVSPVSLLRPTGEMSVLPRA